MARRTNSDVIRELEVTFAELNTVVKHLERGVSEIDAGNTELAKSVAADSKQVSETIAAITTRLAVIEQRFEDLKTSVEQREQKRWAVVLIIISVLQAACYRSFCRNYFHEDD